MYSLTVVTAASVPIVPLAEMKAYLRVDSSAEDALITSQTLAATAQASQVWLWRALALTEYAFTDYTPVAIKVGSKYGYRLPMPPIVSVESVALAGVAQTGWTLDKALGLILFDAALGSGEITVEFTAGYTDPADVPVQYKQAIKLLVGGWFENRESVTLGAQPAEMPLAVRHLLMPYRAWEPQ